MVSSAEAKGDGRHSIVVHSVVRDWTSHTDDPSLTVVEIAALTTMTTPRLLVEESFHLLQILFFLVSIPVEARVIEVDAPGSLLSIPDVSQSFFRRGEEVDYVLPLAVYLMIWVIVPVVA